MIKITADVCPHNTQLYSIDQVTYSRFMAQTKHKQLWNSQISYRDAQDWIEEKPPGGILLRRMRGEAFCESCEENTAHMSSLMKSEGELPYLFREYCDGCKHAKITAYEEFFPPSNRMDTYSPIATECRQCGWAKLWNHSYTSPRTIRRTPLESVMNVKRFDNDEEFAKQISDVNLAYGEICPKSDCSFGRYPITSAQNSGVRDIKRELGTFGRKFLERTFQKHCSRCESKTEHAEISVHEKPFGTTWRNDSEVYIGRNAYNPFPEHVNKIVETQIKCIKCGKMKRNKDSASVQESFERARKDGSGCAAVLISLCCGLWLLLHQLMA